MQVGTCGTCLSMLGLFIYFCLCDKHCDSKSNLEEGKGLLYFIMEHSQAGDQAETKADSMEELCLVLLLLFFYIAWTPVLGIVSLTVD